MYSTQIGGNKGVKQPLLLNKENTSQTNRQLLFTSAIFLHQQYVLEVIQCLTQKKMFERTKVILSFFFFVAMFIADFFHKFHCLSKKKK